MSNWNRKILRNKMKIELGTNKIRDYWHSQNDTLEQRLIRGMKEAQKEDKNGRK